MKKIFYIKFILFLIFAFPSIGYAEVNSPCGSIFNVDVSSVKQYLRMARETRESRMPTDAEWDSLFNSKAYKALLRKTHWNRNEFKGNVRNAFDIVYNPLKRSVCDSISGLLNDLSNLKDELPMFVSTALDIRDNLDQYSRILESVNIDSVVNAANEKALTLLPGKGKNLHPESSPIYFIVWDLECRALAPGLFLDINSFFSEGVEAAIEALGHEMHHFYLGPAFEVNYKEDIMDGAAGALVFNMREGVADLINKKEMPLKSLAPYGEAMLKTYNDDYYSSPKVLEELDSITCQYLDNKLSLEEYFKKALGCAHFEGHTTGDYMVFLIRDHLGLDSVIESVGDLDKFIDNYNKAAEKAGTYRFSNRFTDHIHSVSAKARR
ncbi:MAG: hypothetical protein K2H46_05440 [Muribaculaceae bacterium]|nr:hypothetical protein [Muribaculaceae bacterium]